MKKFFCFLFILITIFALNLINTEQVNAAASPEDDIYTFRLDTTTNSDGFFSVEHGISSLLDYTIKGITVAIQDTAGDWHIIENSSNNDNRFWWNGTYVCGIINESAFASQSVRIIIYTFYEYFQ